MTTTVVYAGTADGYISSVSASSYADARDSSGGGYVLAADTASTALSVGQYFTDNDGFGDEWGIYLVYLGFDTSAVSSGDTVSAAVLNLTSFADDSATDFTTNARSYDWGTGLTTADWIAGASLTGYTLRAHRATSSGWTANTAYDFTDDAMAAGVVKAGTTRLVLCSSHTEGNNAPTGEEYVSAKSADTTGTTSDPKLTVTHAAGGGGGYVRSFAVIVI